MERPRNPEHGDYATNVALRTAKKAGVPPRDLAGWLAEALAGRDGIASAEVAGPGFINLRLAADAQGAIVADVLAAGEAYGTGDELAGRDVNLEFVSANPTGPLHLGGTRWAAVGDALGRVLAARGAKVTREYYFNDAGAQIDRFVELAGRRGAGRADPGERLRRRLHRRDRRAGRGGRARTRSTCPPAERDEAFRRVGVGLMFDEIKQALHAFGTDFDVWFHERSLHDSGAVEAAVQRLKDSGNLYFADGAWWLRSTDVGRRQGPRRSSRATASPAYIAGDLAYFLDKRARGFDLCIYMLGADHHGYIARLRGRRRRVRRRPGHRRGADRADGQPGPGRRSRCG